MKFREVIVKKGKDNFKQARVKSIFIVTMLICLVFAQVLLSTNFWSLAATEEGTEVNVSTVEEGTNNGIDGVKLKWEKVINITNEIHISSAEDFKNLNISEIDRETIIYLDTDITIEGTSVTEDPNTYFRNSEFSGIIDGNGHTITLNNGGSGLFKTITSTGCVKNTKFVFANDINSTKINPSIGSIAETNHGTIENCEVENNMNSNKAVGGIVYENAGTIKNCHTTGTINATKAGGIAYYNTGTIINSYNESSIQAVNDDREDNNATGEIGGIAKENSGTIDFSYNTGAIHGNEIAGIAHTTSGTIKNCWNEADINQEIGSTSKIAGTAIAGSGTIQNCYNKGIFTITHGNGACVANIAGILIETDSETYITNCYNAGNITVSDSTDGTAKGGRLQYNIGGIVANASNAIINNCYNIGDISAESKSTSVMTSQSYKVAGIAVSCNSVTNSYNSGTLLSIKNGSNATKADIACGGEITDCEGTPNILGVIGDAFSMDAGGNPILVYEDTNSNGTEYTSSNGGKISISNTQAGTYKYQVINVPDGYKLDKNTYQVKIDENGIIYNSNDEEIDNIQIVIKKNSKEEIPFSLKITNKDNYGFLINNAKFELIDKNDNKTIATGMTENGEVILTGNIPSSKANEVISYKLKQTINESIYIKVERDIGIAIGENENGNINIIEAGISSSENPISVDVNMGMTVTNQRVNDDIYSVAINVTDSDTEEPVEGSEYRVHARGDDFGYITTTATTNSDGNLTIEGLCGTGIIELVFEHVKAPKDYVKEEINKYITITRDENGNIKYSLPSYEGVFDKFENNTVYVNLTNTPKVIDNIIRIKAVSQEGAPLNGFKFSVKDYVGNIVGTATTNIEGIAEISGVSKNGSGSVAYTIERMEDGKATSSCVINITYTDGKITNATKMTDNIEVSYTSDYEDKNHSKYIVNVKMRIEQKEEEITADNQLIITSVKELDREQVLSDMEYTVTINGTNSINDWSNGIYSTCTTKTAVTDENGLIKDEIYLPNLKYMEVTIKQTKTKHGYKRMESEQVIKLYREDGKIHISGVEEYQTNPYVDENGNVCVIKPIESLEEMNVIFYIKAVAPGDKTRTYSGIQYSIVKDNDNNNTKYVTTELEDYACIDTGFSINIDEKENTSRIVTFKIIQTGGGIANFKSPDVELALEFNKSEGLTNFSRFASRDGLMGLESWSFNPKDENDNTLEIYLDIKNQAPDKDDEIYDLNITKQTEEGKEVSGAEYKMWISIDGEPRIYTTKEIKVTDAVEVIDLPLQNGEMGIILKETKNAMGCKLIDDVITAFLDVNIDEDKEKEPKEWITFNKEKSSNQIKDVNIDYYLDNYGSRKLQVEIILKANEPEVIKEKQVMYNVDIKKLMPDGKTIAEGSVYKVQIDSNGVKEYENQDVPITNEIEIYGQEAKPTLAQIYLTEKTAATGCALDTARADVKLEIGTNSISVKSKTNVSNVVITEAGNNDTTITKNIEIILKASKEDEGHISPSTNDLYFDLDILKLRPDGSVAKGSKYDITVLPNDFFKDSKLISDDRDSVEIRNLKVYKGTTTTIKLKERKAATGCAIDESETQVNLTIDEEGNITWQGKASGYLAGVNIIPSTSKGGKTLVRVVLNAKMLYDIDVKQIKSSTGKTVTGATYDITVGTEESVDRAGTINIAGSKEIKDLYAYEGKIKITLKQREPAKGCNAEEDGYETVVFIDIDDKGNIKWDNTNKDTKDKYLAYVNPVSKVSGGKTSVEIVLEAEEEEGSSETTLKYNVDINKIDSNGENVSNSKYTIKIDPNGGTSTKTISSTNTEIKGKGFNAGKVTVTLTEVLAGKNCEECKEDIIVVLQFNENGTITYLKDESSGVILNDVNVEYDENKGTPTVKIELKANVTESPDPGDDDDDEDDPNATVTFKIYNRSLGDWNYSYPDYLQYNLYYTTDNCAIHNTSEELKTISEYKDKNHYTLRGMYYWHCVNKKTVSTETSTIQAEYEGAEKLLRIFNVSGSDAISHGFNFITAPDITVEARIVTDDGSVQDVIYEEATAEIIEKPNNTKGTHKVNLYEDYKDLTVEFTIKENISPVDYRRNSKDAKIVVTFDEEGKIAGGNLSPLYAENLDEYGIGGISGNGQIDGFQVYSKRIQKYDVYFERESKLEKAQKDEVMSEYLGDNASFNSIYKHYIYNEVDNGSEIETVGNGTISKYNSLGGKKQTIYVGMLNKELDNKISVTVNLKDQDTDEKINGDVEVGVYYRTTSDTWEWLETHQGRVENGTLTTTLDHTYAGRDLKFVIRQTGIAYTTNINRDGREIEQYPIQYKDYTGIDFYAEFVVTLDDEGYINTDTLDTESEGLIVPDNMKVGFEDNLNIVCTIYNEIKYNFAINLTKNDQEGNPLEGVRIKTTASIKYDAETENLKPVFGHGSALTDDDGNVKLKIWLPEEGDGAYFGHTVEFVLDEYYVPDNYRAQRGMIIRINFNGTGYVTDAYIKEDEQTVKSRKEEDKTFNVLSDLNIVEDCSGVDERTAVNLTMKNTLIKDKPQFKITNVDFDNHEIKLQGTVYEIQVRDGESYIKGDLLDINETQYPVGPTNEQGQVDVTFDNAHALRTMVYEIIEKVPSEAYIKNTKIILTVMFDEEGKVIKAELTECPKLRVGANTLKPVAEIEWDEGNSEIIKITIANRLDPKLRINIKREDGRGNPVVGKLFKIIVKNPENEEVLEEAWTTEGVWLEEEIPVTGISIKRQDPENPKKNLFEGTKEKPLQLKYKVNKNGEITNQDEYQLVEEITPSNATNKLIIWTSTDESVVTVDETGKITAMGHGTAAITVTTVDGDYSDTIYVKVSDGGKKPTTELSKTVDPEKIGVYSVGLRTDPANYDNNLIYEIHEYTGTYNNIEQYTLRGIANLEFDDTYDYLIGGEYIDDSYIDTVRSAIPTKRGENYQNVYIVVEDFKVKINVKDITGSTNYDLSGYEFEITNNKGEKTITTPATDKKGQVIETVGGVYKGETVTYTIKQKACSIDYNDLDDITLEITFDEEGTIIECKEERVPGKYDIISTESEDANIEIDIYATLATRNSVIINLTDEDNGASINNAKYEVKRYDADGVLVQTYDVLTIKNGQGILDLGSYKHYKQTTHHFTIKQIEIDNEYMIDDQGIEVAVTYDKNGNIGYTQDGVLKLAKVLSTRENFNSDYMEINDPLSANTPNIVIDAQNKIKTQMDLIAKNIFDNTPIEGAEFKIQQVDMNEKLYSDDNITDEYGKTTLNVGPYYREKEVTYKITNTGISEEYQKAPDLEFKLLYASNGTVESATVDPIYQKYLKVEPVNDGRLGHVKITINIEPSLTIGVDAINENGNRLAGGSYRIEKELDTSIYSTISTSSIETKHTILGGSEANQSITYSIVEQKAPLGYQYVRGENTIIGILQITFDKDGNIESKELLEGSDYITINTEVDKSVERDLDIKISYKEIEKFMIVIKDESAANSDLTIQSTFNGTLIDNDANGKTTATSKVTTDTDGLGALDFGKITTKKDKEQKLTISQSNVPSGYLPILDIGMNIKFNEDGTIIEDSVKAITREGYATKDVSYTIDEIGKYVIRITVKNNPLPTLQLTNVENKAENNKVESTHKLSAETLENDIEMKTAFGVARTQLPAVSKGKTEIYTLTQTEVEKGYQLNKPITITVEYDSDGNISKEPLINNGKNTFVVATVESWDAYTIKLKIRNNNDKVALNILDLDIETLNPVQGAQHTIYSQIGELADSNETILATQRKIYNTWDTTDAKLLVELENAYTLANKKVIYTIETPRSATGYGAISAVYVVVTYDKNGDIASVNGISKRLLTAKKDDNIPYRINLEIGFGTIKDYKVIVSKEDSITGNKLNDVEFNIDYYLNEEKIFSYESEKTKDIVINDTRVVKGAILLDEIPSSNENEGTIKLKEEGHMKVSLTEIATLDGYTKKLLNKTDMFVEFDIELVDGKNVQSDPNDIDLNITNIEIPELYKNILDVTFNKDSREVKITVKNDPVIDVIVNKKDEQENSIIGIKFDITAREKGTENVVNVGTFTTDKDGKLSAEVLNKYAGKDVIITLTEHGNKNYKQIAPIEIEATITEDGKIQIESLDNGEEPVKLVSNSEDTTITEITSHSITLSVTNKLSESAKPFSVNVTKTDEYTNELIEGVLFQAVMIENTEERLYTNGKTDEEGKISFAFVGDGEITIKLTEVTTPNGYEAPENKELEYVIINSDSEFKKSENQKNENLDDTSWSIDSENRVVNITIKNKPEQAVIAIEKVDKLDNLKKIGGATYKLFAVEGETETELYSEATNSEGIAYFKINKKLNGDRTASYALLETVAPNGYKTDKIKKNITVSFTDKGDINTLSVTEGEEELQILEREGAYAKIRVVDEKEEITGIAEYTIVIRDVEKRTGEKNIIPIQGSVFDIDISQERGNPLSIQGNKITGTNVTDSDGYIDGINLSGGGKIKVSIQEVEAGPGFIKNNNLQVANFTLNIDVDENGNYYIKDSDKYSGSDIGFSWDDKTNTAYITVFNEGERDKYRLKVNVIDVADNYSRIIDENAQYVLTINNNEYTASIDEYGCLYVEGLTGLQNLDIPNNESFNISIKEITPPDTYDSIEETQTIKVYVGTMEEFYTRCIDDVKITEGNSLEIKDSSRYFYIELDLLYENIVMVDLEKLDSQNRNLRIEDATYKLTQYEDDGKTLTNIEYSATSDKNGIMSLKVKAAKGKTVKYKLEETKVPDGYTQSEPQDIEITYDEVGNIEKVNDTKVNSDSVTIEITDIQDEEFITAGAYNVVVRDVDAEDSDIPVEGSKFNVYTTHTLGANISAIDQVTNANGYIPTMSPINGAGDVTIEVQNIEAPIGYVTHDPGYVTLTRDKDTGEINILTKENVIAEYDVETNTVIITWQSTKAKNYYSIKVNVVDKTTGNRITDTNASYDFTFDEEVKNKNINENGQMYFTALDIPPEEFIVSILEKTKPEGFIKINELQSITVPVSIDEDTDENIRILGNPTITAGTSIEIDRTTPTHIVLNLIYYSKLYLKSDIYTIDEKTKIISRVISETPESKGVITVKEFIENLDTNATTLTLYDNSGNELETYTVTLDDDGKIVYNGTNAEKIATAMSIKAKKGNEEATYKISVVGDINGDGSIDATDISQINENQFALMKILEQLTIETRYGQNSKVHMMAADINNDGVIDATDISQINENQFALMGIRGQLTLTDRYMSNS